jgi:hypothetical protein
MPELWFKSEKWTVRRSKLFVDIKTIANKGYIHSNTSVLYVGSGRQNQMRYNKGHAFYEISSILYNVNKEMTFIIIEPVLV